MISTSELVAVSEDAPVLGLGGRVRRALRMAWWTIRRPVSRIRIEIAIFQARRDRA